ncbi:MAG: hypothetical protein AAB576_11475, partial [Elusimicrobiota bacterium]
MAPQSGARESGLGSDVATEVLAGGAEAGAGDTASGGGGLPTSGGAGRPAVPAAFGKDVGGWREDGGSSGPKDTAASS